MDTILLINISGQTYQRVDLFEDIPITLTIQQSDLTNLTGRRAPYTRTITLPDTNNNAKIFEHFFEVNGIDFNPLQKVPCVVQYRGTDIFQGVLRLNSVSTNIQERIWEVYILGEVSDFTSGIKDLQLQDLNWTDLNHEANYDNIVLSWEAKDNNTDGLFGGKVLYPMINYGLDYQNADTPSAATPSFTYSFGQAKSFDQSGFPVPEKMWKPAIRLREIVNRIFSGTGYSIQSEFLDSDYFNSIYMDTFQNGKIGIESASAVTNQNIFRIGSQQKQRTYDGPSESVFLMFDAIPGTYDPLNNYNSTNQTFRVPYTGEYFFNLRYSVKSEDVRFLQGKIKINAKTANSPSGPWTTFASSPETSLFDAVYSEQDVNWFFSANTTSGTYIRLFLEEVNSAIMYPGIVSNPKEYVIKPYRSAGIQDNYIQYDLYNGPLLTGENLVDFSLGIANLNCLGFIKSLITMFNLIIVQDENTKVLRIEPYNWFFNETNRETKNFTNILDNTSFVKTEPLSFDLAKEVIWEYDYADFEYLNKLFTDRFDFNFGRTKFTADGNVFQGEQVYTLPFAALPTSGITGAPNFIIPQCYYLNNGLQTAYATLPHIFFWVGNRYAYTDPFKIVEGSWYMSSGGTAVEWTTYPAVSHLSLLDTVLPNLVSDLSFTSTFDFFGNSNTQVAQFTPYDLYSTFWASYIGNIYSPETRRLTGNFYFTPLTVYDTKLSDKIFIKDANYTIERINDADLTNKKLTSINLIKDIVPYYKIEAPAPIYALDPNEAYPGIEPAFNTLCYVAFGQDTVCNETAPLETVITFGTGTLENFRQVYFDTGTSYQIYPAGTYLRQASPASQVFVVVDNFGRILEYNC